MMVCMHLKKSVSEAKCRWSFYILKYVNCLIKINLTFLIILSYFMISH